MNFVVKYLLHAKLFYIITKHTFFDVHRNIITNKIKTTSDQCPILTENTHQFSLHSKVFNQCIAI